MMNADKKLTDNGHKQATQASLQLLPLIMDNIPQAVFWKDRNLVYLGCNQAFAEDAGLSSPEEVVGKTDLDMPWKDQVELYRADDRRVLESGEPKIDYEECQTTPTGALIWLRTSKIPVYDHGQIVAILGMYEDITAHRQAEEARHESEERFRRFTEATIEGVVFHEQGTIVDSNLAALNMFGFSNSSEVLGKNLLEFIKPEFHEIVLKQMQMENVAPYEVVCIRQDGSIFPVETSTRNYKHGDRTIRATTVRDITRRKHIEAAIRDSEEKLRAIYEGANDAVMLLNEKGFFDCNAQALKMFGFKTKEQFTATHPVDISPAFQPGDKDSASASQEHIQTAYQQGYDRFEWMHRRSNGEEFPAEVVLSAFDFGGQRVLQATVRDITQRKQIETKLSESEERYRRLSDATVEGIVVHDKGVLIDASETFAKMFGYELSEVIGMRATEFLTPETREITMQNIRTGYERPYEVMGLRKDGSTFPVEITGKAVPYEGRTVRVTALRDITERKRAEDELKRNVNFTTALLDAIPTPVFYKDQEGKYQGCNRAFSEIMGKTAEEIRGKTVHQLWPSENAEIYHQKDLELMRNGEHQVYESTTKDKDGNVRPVIFAKDVFYDEGGKVAGLVGAFIDISDRKQAEETTKKSEERFRAIADFTYGWETWLDPDEKYLYISPACELVSGYTPDEFIDNPQLLREIVFPEDRTLFDEHLHDHRSTDESGAIEFRIITKKGRMRWIQHVCRAIYDSNGTWQGRRGSNIDITERKRAEQAMRESQQFLQTVMDNIPQLIFWKDRNLNYLGCNQNFAKAAGVGDPANIVGKSDYDLAWKKEEADAFRQDDEAVMSSGQPKYHIIEPQLQADGRQTWADTNKIPLLNATGEVVGVLGTYEDITERKNIEKRLNESEERYRRLSDATVEGIVIHDKGILLDSNETFARMFGYELSEVIGMPATEFLTPETREITAQNIRSGYEKPYEVMGLRKDGSTFPVEITGKAIPYEGRTIRVTALRDITERKQLEAQIQEAFERRGLQVQLTTQVSQSIAAASNLGELYERVVAQVKEQFGYYHTQLLRYDEAQKAVVLVTGYGEIGAKMLAAGHRLPMGEGLIGTAAATGETVLRPTLENDPDWHPNPLLPETKGEIAVPIKMGENILGVLDVQSSLAGSLGADDQLLLEGLCGQIATAIESTRLREEMSERLEEINRLYRAMSHEGWETYREKADIPSGFMYDQGGIRQVDDAGLAQELFANIPLTVPGGEVIGNLAVADDPQRPLTSEEETFLLQVSEQIALALESARLFEQTQTALSTIQENEAKLSEALNIAKLANWEYDLEKDVFIFNDQFYSIFHTTAEKVGGYELSSADYARLFVHPEDAPLVGKEIERGLASTERHFTARLEHRFIFADDGSIGHISVEVHLERDENGKIIRWYGANQDITERKKTEIVIQESRAALAEALDIAKLAHWEYDVYRDRFLFNDQFYSIFHTTAEQMGGYELSSAEYASRLVYPDDLPVVGAAIEKALSSTDKHYSAQLEHRIVYADGGIGYISVEIHIERDEQGKILRYYGANQDITERKLVQDAIAKQAAELETVAQVSTTASTVLNPDQLLQSVVDLARERFGLYHAHIYTFDEAWNTLLLAAGAGEVGRKLVAEEHAIPMSIEQSLVARAARDRKVVIVNDVNSEPGFLPNPLLPETCAEMAVPMTVGDKLLGVFDVQSNNPAGFSERDANIYVTLAAQVGVALQNARSYMEQAALVTQLRELDRLKSSFLANMSHELRTPLNSILGFADVIIEELDGPLTENMSNDLRLIQKNGQHLLHLINDVLDMAKIEAGRMNLNPESFIAFEVMDEVTSITSTLASEKNLALFIDPDSERDVKIYADRTRLRQVMINLVNNAIKFTENGKIALKLVSLEGARVLFTVKDTGIGIPPDKLDAVFQEFTQVDSSTTRKAGGTGLGLPISRRLVEMHGGRLWAESTGVNGEGSTFFVELPIEARITETVEKQAK